MRAVDQPPPPGRSRGLLPPPSRGRAVHGDSPGYGAREGNGISVRVIASTAERLPASVVVRLWGIAPVGEAARRGGGWNSPRPCPDVSPGTVFVEHPFPCLLRLWLNVFRLTNPHLPSMPSRKKPHHAAVARGIPHEDGGSIFIQIPVTPPGICPWTGHGEVYQTSEALV